MEILHFTIFRAGCLLGSVMTVGKTADFFLGSHLSLLPLPSYLFFANKSALRIDSLAFLELLSDTGFSLIFKDALK